MKRTAFIVRLLLPLSLLSIAAPLPAQSAAPAPSAAQAEPVISEAEALAAWQRFKAAPAAQLKEAPVFLKFMQGGAVHTVLNSNLLFWMYNDYPREAQAVLYAAYMGGNMESQLVTRKQGDDPQAGMSAVLDAYTQLKASDEALTIKRLDELVLARTEGRFAAAVDELGQGKP